MTSDHYDPEKFKSFDEMLRHTHQADEILIHHPEVLGDNYTEIVTNLNKMAEAGFALRIVPPSERRKPQSRSDTN